MGAIGWIDFSRSHRDRVYAVIDFLQEEGTVDELGVGSIRNALADFLFPGISTIQTRAKYFFIVPRILWDYQRRYADKKNKPKLSDYLRKKENELIRQLAKKYEGKTGTGVVGITLANAPKGKELARKPSSIYWNGLRTHGIIQTPLSLGEYLRLHDRQHESFRDILAAEGENPGDDPDADHEDLFGIKLPNYDENWTENLGIELNKEEAEFLRDHFLEIDVLNRKKPEENLLRQVLLSEPRIEKFVKAEDFRQMYEVMQEESLPPLTQKVLDLAYYFDELMYGAHLRYNYLVHQQFGKQEFVQERLEEWEQWLEYNKESGWPDQFDVHFLLEDLAVRVKPFTRMFVLSWYDLVQKGGTDKDFMDKLIRMQEIQNKGKKARLQERAEESVEDWVGLQYMNYRFFNARRIIEDIQSGLNP